MAPSATSSTMLSPTSATFNSRRPSRGRFRRLSSFDYSKSEDAADKPTIVVPSETVPEETEATEIAESFELARRQMRGMKISEDEFSIDFVPSQTTDKYAYAFDIDGVLIKGGEVIPEAIQAMKMLNGQNSRGIKVPYIFVTNGGGKSEKERCIQLSKQLELEVSPGQFICGHTPMREMAEKYDCVLVIGGEGEKCREVALEYGFKTVVTPGDIIKTQPDVTPFRKLTEEETKNSIVRDFKKTKVQAIFVFADSKDWGSDTQIILDFLLSKDGELGTRSETFDEGPPLFFAHNDLVWATSHASVRIGMGALRKSVEAMYEAMAGKPLKATAFGKPQIGTFEYATRLLKQWRKDTHGIDAAPDTIYFVGDTPESDIRGTNDMDEHADNDWYSILVRTGVYQKGTKPKYEPKVTVDTVLDAVRHGMEREYKKEMHAKNRKASVIKEEHEEAVVEDVISEGSPTAERKAELGVTTPGGTHKKAEADGYVTANGTNGSTNGTNGVNAHA